MSYYEPVYNRGMFYAGRKKSDGICTCATRAGRRCKKRAVRDGKCMVHLKHGCPDFSTMAGRVGRRGTTLGRVGRSGTTLGRRTYAKKTEADYMMGPATVGSVTTWGDEGYIGPGMAKGDWYEPRGAPTQEGAYKNWEAANKKLAEKAAAPASSWW